MTENAVVPFFLNRQYSHTWTIVSNALADLKTFVRLSMHFAMLTPVQFVEEPDSDCREITLVIHPTADEESLNSLRANIDLKIKEHVKHGHVTEDINIYFTLRGPKK